MTTRTLRWTIATTVGLLCSVAPPMSVVGLLGAALVFPQGVEGDYATAYLVLAVMVNFVLFCWLSYVVLGLLAKFKTPD